MKKQPELINIIKQVKSTINKYCMLIPKDRVVVGVSGGPDSICLLHILYEIKEEFQIELIAAHFNHRLRPGEDEKETEFVKSFVQKLGVPFEYGEAEKDIKREKGSLEENARQLRYEFLEEVRKKYSAQKIALGHNKNDQAETVIMRLLRGSGILGLRGIPPVRDGVIIRPIIDLTRDQILYYLNKKGLSYVLDSSNMDIAFLRNKVRHKLIPYLQRYQPNIVEILSKTAELLFVENSFLESEAEKWIKENVSFFENIAVLELKDFNKLHLALRQRILRSLINKRLGHTKRISFDHINSILGLIERAIPNSEIHLPYNVVVKKRYGLLIIDEKRQFQNYCYHIKNYGRHYLPAIDSWLLVEKTEEIKEKNCAIVDIDKLEFPFIIRNIRAGDRIFLQGIGHKKIKDIFIDMKIPKEIRRLIPILVLKNRPAYIWCIDKIDQRIKANMPKKAVKISLEIDKPSVWKYVFNKYWRERRCG